MRFILHRYHFLFQLGTLFGYVAVVTSVFFCGMEIRCIMVHLRLRWPRGRKAQTRVVGDAVGALSSRDNFMSRTDPYSAGQARSLAHLSEHLNSCACAALHVWTLVDEGDALCVAHGPGTVVRVFACFHGFLIAGVSLVCFPGARWNREWESESHTKGQTNNTETPTLPPTGGGRRGGEQKREGCTPAHEFSACCTRRATVSFPLRHQKIGHENTVQQHRGDLRLPAPPPLLWHAALVDGQSLLSSAPLFASFPGVSLQPLTRLQRLPCPACLPPFTSIRPTDTSSCTYMCITSLI
ncbi:hypothetical protein, conserved [Leishmania tarentolae]|uniref:Uncharacterized protein n=1 Tax=Leishmania tarentolae TaxID=5689 RepID=A0A640KTF8_LEITA|nr:hypothetical protein, conserved [Leishmania tarentolae]